MKKTYRFLARNDKQTKNITIYGDSAFLADRALKRYSTSKAWVHQKYVYIWKFAYKAYHLSVEDRQAYIKSWQENVAFGLIRSFIDVFASTLTERPIAFAVQGLTDDGIKNADNIRHTLAATADMTGFQKEARYALKEGLKTGTFAFVVGMMPDATQERISISTGNEENPYIDAYYNNEIGNFPYAKSVDVFNIFPDVYNGTLRYVTYRTVTSLEGLLDAYKFIIDSDENKSPFKDIYTNIAHQKNKNNADHRDYSIIKDQIHQQINWRFSQEDSFPDMFAPQNNIVIGGNTNTQDNDSDVTDDLIEVLFYTDLLHMVIHANNYPVYIGPNIFGFIPFVLSSTTDEKAVLGCEGVPYLLAGMEKTMNSFMNNYLDSVKVVASPSYVVRKGLFLDEEELENQAPGSILYSESEIGEGAIRRLDKGGVSDWNILEITIKIASQLTGISEYNLGIAQRERTAMGAMAATQSSQKRLSPYLDTYVSCISKIANLWLKMMRQYWIEDQFIVASGDKEGINIKNKDLVGGVQITLNMDSMFSVIQDFGYKKILEVYSQLRSTGVINEDEIGREIFRTLGLDPKRFVPETAPQITQDRATPPVTSAETDGQALTEMVTPQVDLGNGGQGQ